MSCGIGYECSPEGRGAGKGCGQHFGSEHAFMRHFNNLTDSKCLPPEEFVGKFRRGISQDARGIWREPPPEAPFYRHGKAQDGRRA